MFGKLLAAALGAALGLISTTPYELNNEEICYCYQYEGDVAKWTDNCPAKVVNDNRSSCPESIP